MNKRNIRSFRIDDDMWWKAKGRAVEVRKTITQYLEDLITEDLKKRKKK